MTGLSFLLVFIILALGDFLGLARIAPILNYNSMDSACLFAACGLVLLALAKPVSHRHLWLLALAGVLTGFDFFIKFSSSVAFGALVLLVLLLQVRPSMSERVRQMGSFVLGGCLGLLLFFLFFKPFPDWWAGFQHHFAAEATGSHNPLRVLAKGFKDLAFLGAYAVACGALQWFGFRWLKQCFFTGRLDGTVWLIPAMTVLNFLIAVGIAKFRFQSFQFFVLHAALTLVSFAVVSALYGPGKWERQQVLVAVLLFLTPFAIQFGSDASYLFGLNLFFAPWFALLILFAVRLPERVRAVALCSVLVFTWVEFSRTYLMHPWRNGASRMAQSQLITEAGGLQGIRVTPEIHVFLQKTRQLGGAYVVQKEPVVLGIYQLPGLVYWLEGVSPGEPWTYQSAREQPMNCKALHAVPPDAMRRALILVEDTPRPVYAECLEQFLHLVRYREIGQVMNPYSEKPVRFLLPPGEGRTP